MMSNVAAETGRKLFIGPRFRRVRQQLGLSQTQIAAELGVSPSYVNLIERNQRPVTAQILLRLAEAFDLDLRELAGGEDGRSFAELNEVFSDPLFRDIELPKQELQDLTEQCPSVAQALSRLYAAYVEARRGETEVASRIADRDGDAGFHRSPLERVRDFVEASRNHFPTLEVAAQALRDEIDADVPDLFQGLVRRLRDRHGIQVRIMPVDIIRDVLRKYDRHRRQLLLSELVDASGRSFQAAVQLGFAECGTLFDDIVETVNERDPETRRFLRVTLANYFAAAVMMPYARFQEAAERLGYDLVVLGRRFGASFEQVCHRLTTLQRPGARGVPFFLLRVDHAGNVSKRFSSGTFPFSKFGGTCPLWNIHATFDKPGEILSQTIELPDGSLYFSVARTVTRAGAPHAQLVPRFAIALGCEVKYASRLVYAGGQTQEAATPIGVNCRLCDRVDCAQRSEPPLAASLIVDETTRGASPFVFTRSAVS